MTYAVIDENGHAHYEHVEEAIGLEIIRKAWNLWGAAFRLVPMWA